MNTTIQSCQLCNPGCLSCTSTACTQCSDPNQVPSGTQCVCPIGQYTDLTGSCSLCSNFIPQCLQCNRTECSQCTPKFYLSTDKLSCLSCPTVCATCTSSTVCNTCEATFIFDSATTSCKCAAGSFYSIATSIC
jgi:hypothetical protein